MRVKKAGIIVLVCLVSVFVMSPALPMAAETAIASAGAAGAGATSGLSTIGLAFVGAGVLFVIAEIIVGFLDSDDEYIAPTHSAHHGH